MSLLNQQATIILTEAASVDIGIIVRFEFTGQRSQSLYTVTRYLQKTAKELGITNLTFRTSPDYPDNEVWIFRIGAKQPKDEEFPSGTKTLEIGDIF